MTAPSFYTLNSCNLWRLLDDPEKRSTMIARFTDSQVLIIDLLFLIVAHQHHCHQHRETDSPPIIIVPTASCLGRPASPSSPWLGSLQRGEAAGTGEEMIASLISDHIHPGRSRRLVATWVSLGFGRSSETGKASSCAGDVTRYYMRYEMTRNVIFFRTIPMLCWSQRGGWSTTGWATKPRLTIGRRWKSWLQWSWWSSWLSCHDSWWCWCWLQVGGKPSRWPQVLVTLAYAEKVGDPQSIWVFIMICFFMITIATTIGNLE